MWCVLALVHQKSIRRSLWPLLQPATTTGGLIKLLWLNFWETIRTLLHTDKTQCTLCPSGLIFSFFIHNQTHITTWSGFIVRVGVWPSDNKQSISSSRSSCVKAERCTQACAAEASVHPVPSSFPSCHSFCLTFLSSGEGLTVVLTTICPPFSPIWKVSLPWLSVEKKGGNEAKKMHGNGEWKNSVQKAAQ